MTVESLLASASKLFPQEAGRAVPIHACDLPREATARVWDGVAATSLKVEILDKWFEGCV